MTMVSNYMLSDMLELPEAWLGEYQTRYATLSVTVITADGVRHDDQLPIDLPKNAIPKAHIHVEGDALVAAVAEHHADTIRHIFNTQALDSLVAWAALNWQTLLALGQNDESISDVLERENVALEDYETLITQATLILSHAHFRHIPELRISIEVIDHLLEYLEQHQLGVDHLIVTSLSVTNAVLGTQYQFVIRRLEREQRKYQQAIQSHIQETRARCVTLGLPLSSVVNDALFLLGNGDAFRPGELSDLDWSAILATLEQLAEQYTPQAIGAAVLVNYSRELNSLAKPDGLNKVVLLQRIPARICYWGEMNFGELAPTFYSPSSWELLFS